MNKGQQIRPYVIIGFVILIMFLLILGVQSGYIMSTPETDKAILDSFKAKP